MVVPARLCFAKFADCMIARMGELDMDVSQAKLWLLYCKGSIDHEYIAVGGDLVQLDR